MNLCGKYIDMNSMACRTILINPSKQQKKLYTLAFEAHKFMLDKMKPGEKLNGIYNQVKSFVAG